MLANKKKDVLLRKEFRQPKTEISNSPLLRFLREIFLLGCSHDGLILPVRQDIKSLPDKYPGILG
jgi:hypothetical protein